MNKIRKALQLPLHKSRVKAPLKNGTVLQYSNCRNAPVLTPMYMHERAGWVKERASWNDDKWKKALFSGENKFSL